MKEETVANYLTISTILTFTLLLSSSILTLIYKDFIYFFVCLFIALFLDIIGFILGYRTFPEWKKKSCNRR